MMPLHVFIGGEAVAATAQRTFERRASVLGKVATVSAAARVAGAVQVVDTAHASFAARAAVAPTEWRKMLNKTADVMDAKTPDFIAAAETGAMGGWININVTLAAIMLREAADFDTQARGEIIPSLKSGNLAMGVLKPRGVCLGVALCNAPVILGNRSPHRHLRHQFKRTTAIEPARAYHERPSLGEVICGINSSGIVTLKQSSSNRFGRYDTLNSPPRSAKTAFKRSAKYV